MIKKNMFDHNKIKIDHILLNLRIMSKIPKNTKIHIDLSDEIIIENSNKYVSSVKRWIFSYNRKQILFKIKDMIVTAISYVNNINNQSLNDSERIQHENISDIRTQITDNNIDNYKIYNNNKDLINIINNELNNSIQGLDHLIITYKSDQNVVSFIELLKEKIYRHINIYSPSSLTMKDNIIDNSTSSLKKTNNIDNAFLDNLLYE